MGSQKRYSMKDIGEPWVPAKGTTLRRPGNHGFLKKELPEGGKKSMDSWKMHSLKEEKEPWVSKEDTP